MVPRLRFGGERRMIQRERVAPSKTTVLIAALLFPLLAIALVSFIFIRSQQGAGDALIARQHQARAFTAGSVNKALRAAPDPIGHEPPTRARCTPLGTGELRNPWRCLLRYPTGREIQYRVTINPGGSYVGDEELLLAPPPQRRFGGTITGCCVPVP